MSRGWTPSLFGESWSRIDWDPERGSMTALVGLLIPERYPGGRILIPTTSVVKSLDSV